MHGGKFLIKILFWLLLFRVPAAAEPGPVVVFLSDRVEAYSQPVAAFAREISLPVRIVNLKGDINNAPAVMTDILSLNPALIFSLGAKAAYVSKVWTSDRQDIPVLFAMVLNWQRYDFLGGQDNIAGIASDLDPGTQFLNMTIFSPHARRIGVIYSREHSGWIVARAVQAAEKLGLELVATPIHNPKEFQHAFRKIENAIDSFWIVTDPVTYTIDNISWLEKRCLKKRIICIGQSKNVAKIGVLLAVDPDIPNIGNQAAAMAKRILAGKQSPARLGVRPPLGTKLILNLKTARKIHLPISDQALGLVNEVLE